MTRLLRACSDELTYQDVQQKMYYIFKDRGYPPKLIKEIQASVPYTDRHATLQTNQKEQSKETTYMMLKYTPHLNPSNIRDILKPTPQEAKSVQMPCLGLKSALCLLRSLSIKLYQS